MVNDIQVSVDGLMVGQLTKVTAVTTPKGEPVEFQSSDTSIAQIIPDEDSCRCKNSSCYINSIKEGEFTLVVTSGDCRVELELMVMPFVPKPDDDDDSGDCDCKVKFLTDSLILRLGDVYLMKYCFKGDASQIRWESTDRSVATVDGGLITTKKVGCTVIIATYEGRKSVCRLSVVDCDPMESSYKIAVGQRLTIPISVLHTSDIHWTISDKSIVSIDDNNVITGLKCGRAILSATILTTQGPITHAFEVIVVNAFEPIVDLRTHDINELEIYSSDEALRLANTGVNIKIVSEGLFVPKLYYVQIDKNPYIFNYKLCAVQEDVERYLLRITNREM